LVIAYTLHILCSYIHICYIPIHIRFDACITSNHEKWHIYLQIDTKWQRKELFKFWIQKKGARSNNETEYILNIDRYIQIYLFVIKNLIIPCRLRL